MKEGLEVCTESKKSIIFRYAVLTFLLASGFELLVKTGIV